MSLFTMRGVSKRYGGARALQDATLSMERGRIHAVLGENGAGKSTLIKIMSGVVQPDAGEMILDGQPVRFRDPAAANRAGVVCVFQELSLIPHLSVADNISISNPPTHFGIIDKKTQRAMAEQALARARVLRCCLTAPWPSACAGAASAPAARPGPTTRSPGLARP